MSIIQLCNLATSLANSSAFLTCHTSTEFCFCVRMQFHFIIGLNSVISLIGYLSFLLPCPLSFTKQISDQIIFSVYKVVPRCCIKGAEQASIKAGNEAAAGKRGQEISDHRGHQTLFFYGKTALSINPLCFTLGQTLITFFSTMYDIYLCLSFLSCYFAVLTRLKHDGN